MRQQYCFYRTTRGIATVGLILAIVSSRPLAVQADEIVLRNGDRVTDPIVKMDIDGLHLKGRVIGWDEVDSGQVGAARQAAFNRFRESLGLKLFRVRSRLETGDYVDLLQHVEELYPKYVDSRSRTAYMVSQGLMWARLAKGQQAEALEPYFKCYLYLAGQGKKPVQLPGERRLKWDPETGMTSDIAPIWFDSETAKVALPKVRTAIQTLPGTPPAAAFVYYGTLAMAAGDRATAEQFLKHQLLAEKAGASKAVNELQQIVLSQLDIADGQQAAVIDRLQGSWRSYAKSNQAMALYWLGQAGIGSKLVAQQEEGMLKLMHLPALYSRDSPELASAGLYFSMKTMQRLKRTEAGQSLRKQLMTDYGHTYFGRQIHAEISQAKDEDP